MQLNLAASFLIRGFANDGANETLRIKTPVQAGVS